MKKMMSRENKSTGTRIIPIISQSCDLKIEANSEISKRRAAAYARVSTERDEQVLSYESQIDYYTKLISHNPDLELVKVYTDEGISGTDTKRRKGFNSMIDDALNGMIDIIYTKSISRFARNTVDSLVAIRKLKEVGCEVYFEKENIYTFDGKGELLITIMSSLAQEESRSLSENVTWGIRKRFADGKYYMHYKEFLGYERGEDGKPKINDYQAAIVRRIYFMALQGLSLYKIAKTLTNEGIKTPMGKDVWYYSVIESILQNEKYKGDALLQKTYSTSYLTKKRKKNNGEITQYYIENGHPAIVEKKVFETVQKVLPNIKKTRHYERSDKLSKKVKCGFCGNWYCKTVWKQRDGSYKTIWRCNSKFVKGNCPSPYLTSGEIENYLDLAKETILSDKDNLKKAARRLKTSNMVINAQMSELKEIDKLLTLIDKRENEQDHLSQFTIIKLKQRMEFFNKNIKRETETNSTLKSITSSIDHLDANDAYAELCQFDQLVDYLTVSSKKMITATYISGKTTPLPIK